VVVGHPSAVREGLRADLARFDLDVRTCTPDEAQSHPPDGCLFLLCPDGGPANTLDRARSLAKQVPGAAVVVLAPPDWPSTPAAEPESAVTVLRWPLGEKAVRQVVQEATWGCLSRAPAVAVEALRALIMDHQHAVVALDGDLRVRLANRPAEILFGGSNRALAGELWPVRFGGQGPGGERLVSALTQAIDNQDVVELNGLPWHRHTLHVRVIPVRSAAASPGWAFSVLLVADEMTPRGRLEVELRQSRKMAALGSLVSSVAHEINTPLAGIMGYADLLLSSSPPESVSGDLLKIHREAERCRRIVESLLFFGRPRKPHRLAVDLNHLLRETLALLRHDLRVSGISVREELDPHVGELVADPHELQQVLFNLMNNARQAMKSSGGGTLTLRTEREGDVVRAHIVDTGPGIPEEVLPHIFEPFFSTKEVGAGTGLGLSICAEIVETHGGRIHAVSKEGEGATFVVELPAAT